MLFHKAPLELIEKYYPEYSGSVNVYGLQHYIIMKIVRPLVDRHIHSEDTLVDLGCGAGWMVNQLQRQVATAIGIDEVDSGFKKLSNLNFIKGSLYQLPIRGGRVDFAISMWVFEHLKEPHRAITEIQRILKPKGLVLIVVPNLYHPLIMLSTIFPLRFKQWMLYTLNGIRKETVLKTYYRANTEGKLDRLSHEAGFKKVEFFYSDDASYWLFSKFLFRCAMAANQGLTKFHFLKRFKMNLIGLYWKEPF
jgi:ubiquinone/menaquinone biosynthesis C-methylase UbiE